MPENRPSKNREDGDAAPEICAVISANPLQETKTEINSDAPALIVKKTPALKEENARFEARFEPLRADFKKFIKVQNGFLAGLVFAEAKKARDAGNFATAQEMLGELEDLLGQARKRDAETMRKAEKQFKDDYKACERKARSDNGTTRQSTLGHLIAARRLADRKEFIKANQELERVKSILRPPAARMNSERNKPFTVTGIP